MVRKTQKTADESAGGAAAQFADTVKESAQQIWLAGLGAFSKAQEEGGKVFEALVREGMTMQQRTQSAAEETLAEAGSRMSAMASELSSRATGPWGKLETSFEDGVSRTLEKLGVPTARQIDDLNRRVEELSRTVDALRANRPTAGARKVAARRPAAAGTVGKRTARKPAK